jgi:hypothetical protein
MSRVLAVLLLLASMAACTTFPEAVDPTSDAPEVQRLMRSIEVGKSSLFESWIPINASNAGWPQRNVMRNDPNLDKIERRRK